jgi:hypothetical protein
MPSQTFSPHDGWQKFPIPKGVDRVTVDLKGAGSGTAHGGRVQGQIKVKDTDVLYVLVGEAGGAPSGRQGGSGGHGGGAAGGDGSAGRDGGRGGGGASAIRLNSTDGTIRCVAGGAGGKSGDEGEGGDGGGKTGAHGNLGTAGSGQVGNATGGTQIQGGKGGSSSSGSAFNGENGSNKGLGKAGAGGQRTSSVSHGGGGGGGGYRPGGGGAAALIGSSPGGGGGGGSSFTGGLFTGVVSTQGGGPTGDGSVVITWNSPGPGNDPPGSPSEAKVDGKAESDGQATKSTGSVKISAIVRDPNTTTQAPTHVGGPSTQKPSDVRLVVRYSSSRSMTHASVVRSSFVNSGKRAEVKLTGLDQNTRYFARLYAEDRKGRLSQTYNSVNFWTNRKPNAPVLQAPSENQIILDTDAVTFDWAHKDDDPSDPQSAFTIRWRRAATGVNPPGEWTTHQFTAGFDNYVVDPGGFKAGVYYEWTVRTRDQQKAWGPYALPRSFFVLGSINPPRLISPASGHAVDVTVPVLHRWAFRDPTPGESQVKADLRYRVVGTTDWVTRLDDGATPQTDQQWELPVNTYIAGQHYEWQARTYHTADPLPSDWSDSEDFWTYASVVTAADTPPIISDVRSTLGCGHNRIYLYDRGGLVQRGEIGPITTMQWTRQRDEMGNCTFTTNGFGADCGRLLSSMHTWINEIVVYRDHDRVFEGPVTNISDSPDGFSVEAKDVIGYLYRRIARQGYNDAFRLINGVEEGLMTVVDRAALIAADALVRDDPNVLPYLTALSYPDDAREARSMPDYTKYAYAEIDDMAANAGLDYSVIGRRIIFNDTHRAIGKLPELRSEHFASPPVISEYGMSLADYYAVTNGAGLWGAAEHPDSPYRGVEILVSSFSEVGAAEGETMTKEQQEAVRQTLTEQAKRGIASRYPAPYIVRVPDNTQLTPETPVTINQLVPGVWIPLRAKGTVVEISQWQKLDSVTVTEDKTGEKVTVTMSPAPNRGQDPDAEGSQDIAQEAS